MSAKTAEAFHRLFYRNKKRTWNNTYWMGHRIQKFPTDMIVLQELIFKIKPEFIIETGTCYGGSALFFASLLDLIGSGRVITIDTVVGTEDGENRPQHSRITQLDGSSINEMIVSKVCRITHGGRCFVNLDSNHHETHVLQELEIYRRFVPVGSYIVVDDTNLAGNPVRSDWDDPGPGGAVRKFLIRRPEFKADPECEKFYLTCAPGGWLKRTQ